LNFGEFGEFRDSNNQDENVDHFGRFFCDFFPDRWQVRCDLRFQKTVPGEAAMSLKFSKPTLSTAKLSPDDSASLPQDSRAFPPSKRSAANLPRRIVW
jgi:hypothetical protein